MKEAKKYNILIVEDEFINARFMAQTIRRIGHIVVGNVKNADDALERAKEVNIDIVFMDINLNDKIDGVLCAELLNKIQNIAVIYTTAFDDNQTMQDASKTNIYGYLIKPFTENDIKATLLVAIQRAFTREEESDMLTIAKDHSYCLITKTFFIGNTPVHLTDKENKILYILCLNLNKNVSFELLENSVWSHKNVSKSTIRDTVSRLRKKAPLLDIQNCIGVGYYLKSH